MSNWTFYPIFAGTLVSLLGLTRIAVLTQQNNTRHQSLSELAASDDKLLSHFRSILIICGVLFAITTFGFIAPRSNDHSLVYIFGALMIGGELLASLIPAKGNCLKLHLMLALIMALGMFGLSATFWLKQAGALSNIEAVFTAILGISCTLSVADRSRYLIYELVFIFSSHFSLLVAAVALK
jgi:hypothetical protein